MGKSTDKTKWTMTYTPGTKYKLTCLNDNFSEREMSVKVPCGGKVMTDDLYVDVKAKAGSVTLSGPNISASLSIDYTNNKAKIDSGATTITPNITEGWIASGTSKTIEASGEVAIITTTCYVTPKKNSQDIPPSGNYYFKNVSVEQVNNLKTKLTGSTNQPSGSGDATEFSMSPFNSIAICGDDDSSIGIKKYNALSIAFDRATSNTEEHTFNGTVYCRTKNNNLQGGDFLYTADISGPSSYTADITGYSYRYKIQLNVRKVNSNSSLVLGYLYVDTLYEYKGSVKQRRSFDFYYNDKGTGAGNEHVEVFTMTPYYNEELD